MKSLRSRGKRKSLRSRGKSEEERVKREGGREKGGLENPLSIVQFSPSWRFLACFRLHGLLRDKLREVFFDQDHDHDQDHDFAGDRNVPPPLLQFHHSMGDRNVPPPLFRSRSRSRSRSRLSSSIPPLHYSITPPLHGGPASRRGMQECPPSVTSLFTLSTSLFPLSSSLFTLSTFRDGIIGGSTRLSYSSNISSPL